ncbi:Smr/MutS family protein, partial [Bordetella pertussis]|uniref:Smr/MutS family protein n=1 Tax=Bordetella pertussis TaxID=520 RepID=UPI000A55B379
RADAGVSDASDIGALLTDGGTAYVRAGVALRCVRIVHGKGYGSQGLEPVLKDKARTWLVQKADVLAFSEAPERGGGAGALLVLLRQAEAGGRP